MEIEYNILSVRKLALLDPKTAQYGTIVFVILW